MSNSNTSVWWNDLPAQTISASTETALLVPAGPPTANYGTLPSPAFPAATGLSLGWPPDIAGSGSYDGHPFKVRIAGRLVTAASMNQTLKIYQVPASIVAAQTSATLTNDHIFVSLAATSSGAAATQSFLVEAELFWDSVTKTLNGFVTAAQINGVNIAVNSGTAGTNVATTQITAVGVGDLNFIPSFQFGTANGGNNVTVTEFALDRA